MDYSEFKQLIKEGEKTSVDFKIESHAFTSKSQVSNAELAKDICAMANNGNVSSYIVVGVSDNGKKLQSVKNINLTDDNVQSFCKTAIFPPPKVKVYRKKWIKEALPAHKGKDFVMVQIGPQQRQAFRLAKDFIDYTEKLCFRRNEVWIRRGSTSDIATPEEIAKLVEGFSLDQFGKDSRIQGERREFLTHSKYGREMLISQSAIALLSGEMKYSIVRPVKDLTENLVRKKLGKTLVLIYCLPCETSMSQKDLVEISYKTSLSSDFAYKEGFPLPNRLLKSINIVRRIFLLPVLESVPDSRIVKIYPSWRKVGTFSHYYRSTLRRPYHSKGEKKTLLSSSSELLILDKIKSISEFTEKLKQAITEAEDSREKIIKLT